MDGAAHTVEIDGDAHEELHRAEREVNRPREHAELLGREAEVALQRRRHDRADGAKRRAHVERAHQRQQHPQRAARGQGFGGGCAGAGGHGLRGYSDLPRRVSRVLRALHGLERMRAQATVSVAGAQAEV